MNSFKKFKPLILLVSVFILCYSIVWYISAAWTDAPGTPPTCPAGSPGCDAPINTGPTPQIKTGDLTSSRLISNGRADVGNIGSDYLPNSANWQYNLLLNAQDNSSIGFHDSGVSVSSIRYNNLGFIIGANDGWGVKSVSFPGGVCLAGVCKTGWDQVGGYWQDGGSGKIYYNGGNVGIGTASPGVKLHIQQGSPTGLGAFLTTQDTVGIDSDQSYNFITFRGGSSQVQGMLFGDSTRGTGNIVYYNNGDSNQHLDFGVGNGVMKMTILSSGNVGIGTTGPAKKLEIKGDHYTTQARLFSDHYGQGLDGGNTAVMSLWASEPGWTWTGVGIGNNINGSPYYGRVTNTRGGSYIRLLDNSIYLSTVNSLGAITDNMSMSAGNVGIAANLNVGGGGSFGQPVSVGTPTAPSHAVTKSYLESVLGGGGGLVNAHQCNADGTCETNNITAVGSISATGQINAASAGGGGGFMSSGNYGGTGNAAYFPQGLWSNGGAAWIYGTVYLNGLLTDTASRWQINPTTGMRAADFCTNAGKCLNNLGAIETDPIWSSQKGAYATQAWVTGLGYTTQAWVQAQGYATQSWVNSQGFLRTETDPIWNSQKGAYATQAWVTGLGYTTQAWVQAQGYATQSWVSGQGFATQSWVTGQNYTTLSAVQSWISSQNYLKDGSSASSLTVGKLNVTTIDPVYEIEGKKYATYVSDFAGGVRIETSGVLQLPTKTIDFTNLEKGSDLWLFWQASNKNIQDLVVILTPSFEGKVWYEKQNDKIVINSDQAGEVSYRLSMPRKDANDWPNLLEGQ